MPHKNRRNCPKKFSCEKISRENRFRNFSFQNPRKEIFSLPKSFFPCDNIARNSPKPSQWVAEAHSKKLAQNPD
jgi:hypothetical protein